MNNVLNIKFQCIDYWNRAIYKIIDRQVYLSDTEHLWDYNTPKETIDDYYRNNITHLTLHGENIDDYPIGISVKKSINFNIV